MKLHYDPEVDIASISLEKGSAVSFEMGVDNKTGKTKAISVDLA